MGVFHVTTDVHRWGHPTLSCLDATLCAAGSVPLSLPWWNLTFLPDGEHLTPASQGRFDTLLIEAVAPQLQPGASVYVVTDSTVAHHDHEYHGSASRSLERAFLAHPKAIRATVDAVCGSGFVALASERQHFYHRLSRVCGRGRGRSGYDHLLFVGGWNDVHEDCPVDVLLCTAASCVRRFGVS